MDRARLEAIVAELDREIPHSGARVQLDVEPSEEHHSALVANEAGFLRFGVEMLKAGLSADGNLTNVEIENLISPASTISFDRVEKRENLYESPDAGGGWLLPSVGLVVVLLVTIVFTVGVVTSCQAAARWVSR